MVTEEQISDQTLSQRPVDQIEEEDDGAISLSPGRIFEEANDDSSLESRKINGRQYTLPKNHDNWLPYYGKEKIKKRLNEAEVKLIETYAEEENRE